MRDVVRWCPGPDGEGEVELERLVPSPGKAKFAGESPGERAAGLWLATIPRFSKFSTTLSIDGTTSSGSCAVARGDETPDDDAERE